MKTALIHDPSCIKHNTGNSPECSQRYQVILSALQQDTGLWNTLKELPSRSAAIEDLLRCHDKQLIERVKQFCAQGGGHIDEDTIVSTESYQLALLAAGAALTGVDEVMSERVANVFSLARPPGHHATHNQAMGFCLFNNAAIAARYAQHQYGIKNVLIIDWDVHHGNGTQDIFYKDPSVFYFSIHEYPFYPHSGDAIEIGAEAGKGFTLNIPLPAGTSAELYRQAFQAALQNIEKRFIPDLIIISAGFDARKDDPLADFVLSDQDFFEMTKEVMALADKYCGGKIISVLEGGYKLDTLGDTVRHHVLALST